MSGNISMVKGFMYLPMQPSVRIAGLILIRAIEHCIPLRGPVPYNSTGPINKLFPQSHRNYPTEFDLVFQSTACNAHIKVCLTWCHYWVLSHYKQNSDRRKDVAEL